LKAISGGEPLSLDLASELLARANEVWNGYGPTEATVYATTYRVSGDEDLMPIGHPIANTEIYIADDRMRSVPVGSPGEICIGGVGVADGYLNRDELTADRFVELRLPWGESRWVYRTGDIGRIDHDGMVHCFGRSDHQVKVRGFRIELGEIEAALIEHQAIRQVVAHTHGEGTDVLLVAYAVFEANESLTATDVRRFLGDRLPHYMIPSLLTELDEIPLTPNGKVDRKALPDPLLGGYEPEKQYAPPQNAEEEMLAEVWAELLDVKRVGRDDNFFDLGGHSLLSMKAVAIIEKRMGIRLNHQTLFFQTLGQLAERLQAKA
jgi:acyl-CoA synthetase (AMP-forming)/AMP-acid ligase II/acyl carrier protein